MVNRKVLKHTLKIYDTCGNSLHGIKSVYVNRLACVQVNGEESESFKY